MICWNVGVAASAVWAWSVTCPFGSEARFYQCSRRSEQTGAVRDDGRMFHASTPARSGYSHGSRPAARAEPVRAGATATRAPAGGCDGDASAGPPGVRRPYRSTTAGASARALRRARPRPHDSPLSRRRDAQRAQARAACGTRTAGARRAAPRRSRPTAAARAARPAAATAPSRSASMASGVIGTASPTQSAQTRPPRAAEKPKARPPTPQAAQWSSTGR